MLSTEDLLYQQKHYLFIFYHSYQPSKTTHMASKHYRYLIFLFFFNASSTLTFFSPNTILVAFKGFIVIAIVVVVVVV